MNLSILQDIGGTPTDSYGNLSDRIEFPCTVIDSTGARYEKAVLSFRRVIPTELQGHERFVEEGMKIEKSDYAIPAHIRKAFPYASETSNGFYPTVVKTPDGLDYVINGVVNIAVLAECKTKDLALSETPSAGVYNVIGQDPGTVYFIGHWTEELEKLRLVPLPA